MRGSYVAVRVESASFLSKRALHGREHMTSWQGNQVLAFFKLRLRTWPCCRLRSLKGTEGNSSVSSRAWLAKNSSLILSASLSLLRRNCVQSQTVHYPSQLKQQCCRDLCIWEEDGMNYYHQQTSKIWAKRNCPKAICMSVCDNACTLFSKELCLKDCRCSAIAALKSEASLRFLHGCESSRSNSLPGKDLAEAAGMELLVTEANRTPWVVTSHNEVECYHKKIECQIDYCYRLLQCWAIDFAIFWWIVKGTYKKPMPMNACRLLCLSSSLKTKNRELSITESSACKRVPM